MILLELLLKGCGCIFMLHHRNEIRKRLLVSKGTDVKIICLGDSNTFGSESSYGNSYPEQLERLLNRGIENYKFTVYNLGIPNQNSFQVKDSLEKKHFNL